ncbi:two-component system chemotaxis response regulator CheB [Chitinophaga dinghuensis]|uniref:protein-glutamate methylesterase n=1 Tax=Chitinophaga dinghuensis TaxID=1539050 RepID=A0A327VYH6_9BACT|nr:chemotaxis protein CheB [Chitinophaga dinghuensis]RAJ82057.1 two-component system chemotaxis response regulator CheB [Chitinophaga dinghuensis]
MQSSTRFDIIAIGGSAGSLAVVARLLKSLPGEMNIPVVLIMHRLKNVSSELNRLLAFGRPIQEPEDKQRMESGHIYLAPQNYHLLLESDGTFSLDYSELVHYSRPAIDESFFSIADAYGQRALGILLSGASADGAEGLARIVKSGGIGIVQDPAEAEFRIMPQAAIDLSAKINIMTTDEIITYIRTQYHTK